MCHSLSLLRQNLNYQQGTFSRVAYTHATYTFRLGLAAYRSLALIAMGMLLSLPLFADTERCVPAAAASAAPHGMSAERFHLSAERLRVNPNQRSLLQGAVQLERGRDKIRAERIAVDARSKTLKAEGNVRYTNCDARAPSWFISADELTLNNKQAGVVKRARLHLGTFPFLYLPRYRIDLSRGQRRSGLLSPRLRYNDNSGIVLGSPLYFNIAPNKDATLTPEIHSRRGMAIDAKARYLYTRDEGRLGLFWLDDTQYNAERYFYFFEHRAYVDDLFHLDIKVQRVSDVDYIEDLGGSADLLNESYLRSYLDGNLFWRGWSFNFQTEMLQRADADADWLRQPYQYQIRPGLKATRMFSDTSSGMNFELQFQAAQFIHKYNYRRNGDGSREYIPAGNRFHHSLRMDWPYRHPGFFFVPAVSISQTHYKIYHGSSINRTQPIYSVHSGLIFNRSTVQDRTFRHTIEPTLFYLNVPARNQDAIPLFDTTVSEFNYHSLFYENRFNGIDRIGDADQLTVALNSRWLHRRSGKEALRVSAGRIYYFRDPQVSLGGRTESNPPQSPLIGELKLDLNNKISFLSSWIWDSKQDRTLKLTSKLSLKGKRNRAISLYYRSQADDFDEQFPEQSLVESSKGFEQAGVNLGIALNERWTILAAWSYSFDADDDLSAFASIEYRSCCWTFGISMQRRLIDVDNDSGRLASGGLDYDNFLGFKLSLNGLGGISNGAHDALADKIFAYP